MPFEGVKVVDFSWVLAGPLTSKYLADYGATVVRIESMIQPDLMRTSSPYVGKPGVDRSAAYAYFNANKYSMALNLRNPKGIEVAKRLVQWADIVSESFTPGQMEGWGLGYEDLKKIKPGIIMLRSSNQGQTGPHARRRGFGILLASLVGFNSVIGWPDRGPTSIYVGYTDFIAPRFAAAALIAALDHRRRTGEGQYVDVSQFETGLHFLSPLLLDRVANQREPRKMDNAAPDFVPHAAYRCRGEDRWCVISVETDIEWQALCAVMGNEALATDKRFGDFKSRKQNEGELNQIIEDWTLKFSPEEVMSQLQQAGVAAGVVQNTRDVYTDPQLCQRNHLWKMSHPEMGEVSFLGQSARLSQTPAQGRMPSPCLGEHTEMVCKEFLDMPDEEFVDLVSQGVFE